MSGAKCDRYDRYKHRSCLTLTHGARAVDREVAVAVAVAMGLAVAVAVATGVLRVPNVETLGGFDVGSGGDMSRELGFGAGPPQRVGITHERKEAVRVEVVGG